MSQTSIIDDIRKTIESLDYGSVEVVVQAGEVTQISTRIIKKTNIKHAEKTIGKMQKAGKHGINLNFKY